MKCTWVAVILATPGLAVSVRKPAGLQVRPGTSTGAAGASSPGAWVVVSWPLGLGVVRAVTGGRGQGEGGDQDGAGGGANGHAGGSLGRLVRGQD